MTLPYMFPNGTDETRLFGQQRVSKVSIPAGQSFSEPQFLGSLALTAIRIPQNWTPATVTFQSAIPEIGGPGVWYDLVDADGDSVGLTFTQNTLARPCHVAVVSLGLRSGLWVRVCSGTPTNPVAQINPVNLDLVFGGVA